MNIDLGKEITTKRKEKGMTQADIAAQFGITVQAVSKWERGLSKPSVEIFNKLVDFLGLDVESPPTEKKQPRFIWFIISFYHEIIKTICVGVILASTVCLPLKFISSEVAITLIGAATSLFCFLTLKNIDGN
ncbi:MAG: helix-turn-helix transcriptional regulator [Clostridia bacterium]|nr:helix-turn-helix transcriptional regulator [Clostridia bacterium]